MPSRSDDIYSEDHSITTVRATQAKSKLRQLMDQTTRSHEPIMITDQQTKAVLISEEDWRAMQETVYLLSIPGMRASIRKSLKTQVSKCAKDLRW